VFAHGRVSLYLLPRVARHLVQFTRLDARGEPHRYAALPAPGLSAMSDDAWTALWSRARTYQNPDCRAPNRW